jgi:hypothetical protein
MGNFPVHEFQFLVSVCSVEYTMAAPFLLKRVPYEVEQPPNVIWIYPYVCLTTTAIHIGPWEDSRLVGGSVYKFIPTIFVVRHKIQEPRKIFILAQFKKVAKNLLPLSNSRVTSYTLIFHTLEGFLKQKWNQLNISSKCSRWGRF